MLTSIVRVFPKFMRFVVVAVAAGFVSAYADDSGAPMFSFSGFGTLGVVHSDENEADFTTTIFKPDGAGYSHNWSADVDSLIAGQVTANFSPEISAVLQVVSQQDSDNSYAPKVEWANIKYQFTPDFSMRLGRTSVAGFMVTDTRMVGYTFPWVRPPLELYSRSPFTSNGGFDTSYRLHLGDRATNTFTFHWGRSDADFDGGSIKVRGGMGVANSFELGSWAVHFSLGRGRFTIPEFEPLFDAFRQFGGEGAAIADKYETKNRLLKIVGIGVSYDPGDWFLTSEWGRVETDSVLGESNGWYVSSGRRFGTVTPYLTYAEANADNRVSDPGLTVSSLPPFLAGPALGLNAALNRSLSNKAIQNTTSIGARWDFVRNVALKLQFDRVRIHKDSAGTLTNVQPGFEAGGHVNVFSATLDFVL